MASAPHIVLPNLLADTLGATIDSGSVLDAADEAFAGIMQAPVDGDIETIHFRIRGHTTNSTLEVRIETIDVNGDPSGTLFGTDTEGTVSVTGVGNYSVTLTAPATVAREAFLAVVVKQPSSSAGNTQVMAQQIARTAAFPYGDKFESSAWTKDGVLLPAYTLEYSDGYHWQIVGGRFIADTGITFNSGTFFTDEIGNSFTFPFTHSIQGVAFFKNTAVGGTYVIKVYDSDDTLLTSKTLDPKFHISGAQLLVNLLFDETVEIAANETYRITVAPPDTTDVAVLSTDYPDTNDRRVDVGYENVFKTARADGGAWADDETAFVWIAPILSDLIAEVGGGGGRILGMAC